MAETLVIHCHDLAGTRASWLVKGGLQILTGAGTLEDAAILAKGRRVLALIPADEALVTQVEIPTKNRQRLLQAIPFALETELTQDVEELHFAVGATVGQNTTPVVVISRIRIEKWLSALESQGIEPQGLYLDLLCLPHQQESWSLLIDQAQLQILSGLNQGFCADRENAPELLQIALQQAGDTGPQRLALYRLDEQEIALPEGIETESIELDSQESLIGLLAEQLNEKSQINLLQGEYKKVDKFTLQWKRWLPAAVLAGVALLLSLTLNLFDYYRYKQQSVDLKREIEQVFRQAFPDIKRIVDPKFQMEQELKTMRGGQRGGSAQFGSLFVPAAAVIKSSPDTRLENISFRDGLLDLQLTIKELQALEKLKQAIEEKGLRVEIRTANATGNQVSSHLRISGKGT
jgi:general secretion pathway protein L